MQALLLLGSAFLIVTGVSAHCVYRRWRRATTLRHRQLREIVAQRAHVRALLVQIETAAAAEDFGATSADTRRSIAGLRCAAMIAVAARERQLAEALRCVRKRVDPPAHLADTAATKRLEQICASIESIRARHSAAE